jgi:hypothetical protein
MAIDAEILQTIEQTSVSMKSPKIKPPKTVELHPD